MKERQKLERRARIRMAPSEVPVKVSIAVKGREKPRDGKRHRDDPVRGSSSLLPDGDGIGGVAWSRGS